MARRLNMVFFVAIAITALLLQSSTAQTVYVVGDALGWVVPPNGAVAYTTWAANKTFTVGDILVFNFINGNHNVAEVTKANFDACNINSPISLTSTSPANITLNASGEHHYICTFTDHCSNGQKLAINVSTASSPAPQPSTPSPIPVPAPAPQPRVPSPVPNPAPTPAPSRSPMTYIVGDALGWNILPNSSIAYQSWARGKTFMVGDTLVFNYVNGTNDVAEVNKQAYESCNTTSPLSLNSNPPTRINLTTTGEHFFTCTFTGRCSAGQKLAINVTGSATTMPPSPTALPPSPTASAPVPTALPPSTTPPPPTSTTPPSPSPTSVATPPPPPPPNSATSLGVAGLSATFLSIVVALLY